MPKTHRAPLPAFIAVAALTVLQGCSSTHEGSSSRLLGENGNGGKAPRQTSGYDADGPSPAAVYRGGRDPATGRAQEWAPASPPPQAPPQMTAMAPLAPVPMPSEAPAPQFASRQPSAGYEPRMPPPPYRPEPPAYYPAPSPPPYVPIGSAPAAAQPGRTTVVDVRQGDTLYRLSKTYNVSVPTIMQANGLTSETLKIGQRLNIPAQ